MTDILLALAMVVLGGLAWVGQTISWVAPDLARRWGLTEQQDAVTPVFWADVRGEAAWDTFTLWCLPAAGVLLFLDSSAWAPFAMAGGAVYLYFAGRGILTRLEMQRRDFAIGAPGSVRVGLLMLGVWGVLGTAAIVVSAIELA